MAGCPGVSIEISPLLRVTCPIFTDNGKLMSTAQGTVLGHSKLGEHHDLATRLVVFHAAMRFHSAICSASWSSGVSMKSSAQPL
jgi:hypothetical protein